MIAWNIKIAVHKMLAFGGFEAVRCNIMSLTLADWFVTQVKVFSFFMITWVTTPRPDGLDGHG